MTTPETQASTPSTGRPPGEGQTAPSPQGGPPMGHSRPAGGPRPGQGRGGPRPGGAGGRPRGRFAPRRRVCSFCVEHVKTIDYKDVDRLRRYLSDRAKIEPPRKTGVCAKHQRILSAAIKRARQLALLPFVPMQGFSGGYRR